jgi:hypothetical protein
MPITLACLIGIFPWIFCRALGIHASTLSSIRLMPGLEASTSWRTRLENPGVVAPWTLVVKSMVRVVRLLVSRRG